MFHGALHVFANDKRTGTGIMAPPSYECVVVSSFIAYLPVDLWYAIVQPAVVYPEQNVGIQVIIVLQSAGVAAYAVRALVAIDAKGDIPTFTQGLALCTVL